MNHPRNPNHRWRLPAALLPLLLMIGAAGPAFAVDGVIEINHAKAVAGGVTPGDGPGYPVTISEWGSYRLTGNLYPSPSQDAIDIPAEHVTLDLNGFTIAGGSDGIVLGQNDIEIRNGTILWTARHGIFAPFTLSYFVRVIGVRVVANGGNGIRLEGEGFTVDGCTAEFNGGVGIWVGEGSIVMNSVARRNTGLGLVMRATTGFRSNVVTENNGGNANPQTASGIELGPNVCGTDLVCP